MKKFSIFFLVFLFSLHANAQDTTGHPKYALSFGIGENFTLTKFYMDIAVKRIYKESQLRVFLSPQISLRETKEDYVDSVRHSNIESNNYGLGIGADYLWSIFRKNDFQLYGGPGIIASYYYGKETLDGVQLVNMSAERVSNSYRIGLRAALGVEWLVSSSIGIHSEYLFTLSYTTSKYDLKESLNNITSKRVIDSKVISFGSNVFFGISIYF